MTYELRIWGPGFGLPSIDAPSLAAVAYLKQCLPADAWILVPDNDPSQNPLGQLPAIKHNDVWAGGYHNIVEYLRASSSGRYDLDKVLTASQRADLFAYNTLIESRGQPLLDLSLYVSTENYTTSTKRALGQILSWPDTWFVPHRLREQAKTRSDHLGLSGLDVDTAQDKREDTGLTASIPRSLRKTRQTVTSLLGKDIRRNKFRLDAVTEDFLEPLEDMLGGKNWLIGDAATSVDCLAMAYLILMHGDNDLPQPWIREALKTKHLELEGWLQEKRTQCFGAAVPAMTTTGVLAVARDSDLPWRPQAERTWQQIINAGCLNVAAATPWLSPILDHNEIMVERTTRPATNSASLIKYMRKERAIVKIRDRRLMVSQIWGSSICIAVATGFLFWNGLLVVPKRVAAPQPRSFGEAGAMLGLI